MSATQRIEGNRVYCHVCDHEWDRTQGGLQCPACESEFVEIIESGSTRRSNSPPGIPPRPRSQQPPSLPSHSRSPRSSRSPDPFLDHNPWAPDPDEGDITTFEFNTGGGRGTFSFSTRSYTIGGGNMTTSRDMAGDEIARNFEAMLGNIMGLHQTRQPVMGGRVFEFPANRTDRNTGLAPDLLSMLFQGTGQARGAHQPPSPFDLIGALLNPANARRGDAVFSQEAFDRVMTQLMEQNSSSAPGPASDVAIAGLKKKPVDQSMMGSDGKAECSICMDNVEIGNEVTFLPCNHWFHGDCITLWLREHDTCPHCRKPITNTEEQSSSPTSRRRRTSRRSSSLASPMGPVGDGINRDMQMPDTPSGLRDARQRFYASALSPESQNSERPAHERSTSERSHRSSENGGGGGVAGWLRNRLPFSGQQ